MMRSVRWGTTSLTVGLMNPMVDLTAAIRASLVMGKIAPLTGVEQDIPEVVVSRPLTWSPR